MTPDDLRNRMAEEGHVWLFNEAELANWITANGDFMCWRNNDGIQIFRALGPYVYEVLSV